MRLITDSINCCAERTTLLLATTIAAVVLRWAWALVALAAVPRALAATTTDPVAVLPAPVGPARWVHPWACAATGAAAVRRRWRTAAVRLPWPGAWAAPTTVAHPRVATAEERGTTIAARLRAAALAALPVAVDTKSSREGMSCCVVDFRG
jgi:hypothetical protein